MMDNKPTANEMAKMIDNCLARAEAAEKRIAVATEMARDANREANREREAKETAIARIAALEAQPAAQAWRPVTTIDDEAPDEGMQVELLVRGYLGDDGYWYYKDGDNPVRGWRPLPPPSSGE